MPRFAMLRYASLHAHLTCDMLHCAMSVHGVLCAMLSAGHPKNKEMMLSVGPQRLAAMLKRLGPEGAVQVRPHIHNTPAKSTHGTPKLSLQSNLERTTL
jgi:hypothetical protein